MPDQQRMRAVFCEAWVVTDPGFGDAGKGRITDHLVRERGASLVVRFNGGAQASHNVVTPGGRRTRPYPRRARGRL